MKEFEVFIKNNKKYLTPKISEEVEELIELVNKQNLKIYGKTILENGEQLECLLFKISENIYFNALYKKQGKNYCIEYMNNNIRVINFVDNFQPIFEEDNKNFYAGQFALEQTEKEEIRVIDWSKVPVDTLLVVSNREDFSNYQKMYFKEFKDEEICCFSEGRTSKTTMSIDDYAVWKYAKIVMMQKNIKKNVQNVQSLI